MVFYVDVYSLHLCKFGPFMDHSSVSLDKFPYQGGQEVLSEFNGVIPGYGSYKREMTLVEG